MAALSDVALIREMRARVPAAWAEFDARYRPLLEAYAERTGIPKWERAACISEVLDDVALYLADRAGDPPANLEGYLVRAVRNRYLKIKRAAIRREQHYSEAVGFDGDAEQVIRELCSEDALRASAGPGADAAAHSSHALRHLAGLLGAQLSADEMQMLGWVGAGVPRRQIAEWLGLGYDAARKRLYRLSRRLYALIPAALNRMSVAERAEAERFLRRIGLGNEDQREAR
jgi:DNA-directed RNA polymerase specialized sigma24 family protein